MERGSRTSFLTSAAAIDHLSSYVLEPAFEEGARNALETCLGVRADQRVLVLTHAGMESIAASLVHVGRTLGARMEAYVLTAEDAKRDTFVARLFGRLLDVDVSFVVSRLDGIPFELRRRVLEVGTTERRHGHMVGITPAMMEQAMRADYREVEILTARIAKLMKRGARVRVRAPGGTDFEATLASDSDVAAASGVLSAPGWTNLPGGEVFAVPSSVDGVIVPDAGVWFPDGSEVAHAKRHELFFEKSQLSKILGPPETVQRLTALLDGHENSRRIGQVGLGTNTGVLAPIGELLQDMMLPGAHFTLGRACPELTGAIWDSDLEIPLLVRRATVTIDGEPVMTNGKYAPALLAR
jgi:leucyl aminopeptidase (aminopeptidase T)